MKTFFKAISVLVLTISLLACQKDPVVIKIKADPPKIDKFEVTGNKVVYGEALQGAIQLSDVYELKEVKIDFLVAGKIACTNSPAIEGEKTLTVDLADLEFIVPFEAGSTDQIGILRLTAMNEKLKNVEQNLNVEIRRPQFEKLYFKTSDAEYELSKGTTPETKDVYSVAVEKLPNGIEGFFYTEKGGKGLKWGYDDATKLAALGSDTAITLIDSDSVDGTVSTISFNTFTFTPAPLKKVMSVQGVPFGDYLPTVLKANVKLESGKEVAVEKIDLSEVLFDPDFFTYADNKLTYTGATEDVVLYYNREFQFVFVQNAENTNNGTIGYPGNLVTLGYKIAMPDISLEPGWDFGKGYIFRKVASTGDASANTYTATLIVNKELYCGIYKDTGWNYIQPAQDITYNCSDFVAKKEDGKDSYVISMNPELPDGKEYIYKITLTVDSEFNTTLDAVKLRELNRN